MNDYQSPERDTAPIAADLTITDDRLARCKRASLGCQALRVAWDLGALARRVEREAPGAHRRLLDTVDALQRLGELFAPGRAGDPPSRSAAGTGAPDETSAAGSFRQGELF